MSVFPQTSLTLLHKLAVQMTAASDEAAWTRFFNLYTPAIRKFVEWIDHTHDPDDVIQDIYIKLVEVLRSGKYNPEKAKFRSFLATMIRRHLISLYRKDQARCVGAQTPLDDVELSVPSDQAERLDLKWRLAKHEAAAKVWGEYQAELARRKKLPADEAKALGELKRPPYPAKQYAGLFEEYIEPMIPFPFKGVIWYQGEANAMFAQGYVYRFYRDWRARWQAPEMPFLVVQLPHYNRSYIWGDLRDSQNFVAAAEKNVKIVPTFDIGDMKNIHPPKKPELGARLSRFARQFVYGEKGVKAEGPVFVGVEPKGCELLVKFAANAALASADGEPIRGLTVAGKDGRHVDATVKIVDANTLSVSSPQVKEPVAVRYGWASPDATNFVDAEGRPVGAFRSDDGKLATQR